MDPRRWVARRQSILPRLSRSAQRTRPPPKGDRTTWQSRDQSFRQIADFGIIPQHDQSLLHPPAVRHHRRAPLEGNSFASPLSREIAPRIANAQVKQVPVTPRHSLDRETRKGELGIDHPSIRRSHWRVQFEVRSLLVPKNPAPSIPRGRGITIQSS